MSAHALPRSIPPDSQLLQPSPQPVHEPMEIWISNVLRGGVAIAAIVVALGLLIFVLHGSAPSTAAALRALSAHAGRQASLSPGDIVSSIRHGQGRGVIELGLLMLILTPVSRVALTAVLFIKQRDHIFAAITVVVLAILILGLIGFGA